jgi:hypothetical protein
VKPALRSSDGNRRVAALRRHQITMMTTLSGNKKLLALRVDTGSPVPRASSHGGSEANPATTKAKEQSCWDVTRVLTVCSLEEQVDQLGTGAGAQLAVDAAQVEFDGLGAEEQGGGDVAVGAALGD